MYTYIHICIHICIHTHISRDSAFGTAAAYGRSVAPESPPLVTLEALEVPKKNLLFGPLSSLFPPFSPVSALFLPFPAFFCLFCAL